MRLFRSRLAKDGRARSTRRGVTPEDIKQAAQSNITVDHNGGSKSLGSARARRRRARERSRDDPEGSKRD